MFADQKCKCRSLKRCRGMYWTLIILSIIILLLSRGFKDKISMDAERAKNAEYNLKLLKEAGWRPPSDEPQQTAPQDIIEATEQDNDSAQSEASLQQSEVSEEDDIETKLAKRRADRAKASGKPEQPLGAAAIKANGMQEKPEEILKKAVLGNALAQYKLGQILEGKQDLSQAEKWYRKAAEQGNDAAQEALKRFDK